MTTGRINQVLQTLAVILGHVLERESHVGLQVFCGKQANLEAQAAQKTQDTKNALFGVCRFQRFLLQKRSGDEATSLVTSSAGWKLCSFEPFWDQKSKIIRGL